MQVIILILLLYVSQYTHSQPANCDEAGNMLEWPIADAQCRAMRPLNGACCHCESSDPQYCEGCSEIECPPTSNPTLWPSPNPTDFPTLDPTSSPTSNPTPVPAPQPSINPSLTPTTAWPTSYPTSKPTVYKIKCNQFKTGYFQSTQTEEFALFITVNDHNVNINTCDDYTTVNTTLTLYDKTRNTIIASRSDGCNNEIGGSKLIINDMNSGEYMLKLAPVEQIPDHTHLYKLSVLCNTFKPTSSPTTVPTENPTTYPSVTPISKPTNNPIFYPTTIPTATPTNGCQECVYDVKLTYVNNITIEECKKITPLPTMIKSPTARSTTRKPIESYWQKRDKRYDSSSGSSDKYKRKRKKKSSDSRRRLRHKPWNGQTKSETKWIAERNCIDRDSDGTNGFKEYYKNKCDIEDCDFDEDKYGKRYTLWSKRIDKDDEFVTEVCMKYDIIDLIDENVKDCGEIRNVFLGICENDSTDFDLSTLDENDLTKLITSINNGHFISATGAKINNKLGILITFDSTYVSTEFELCLGNVIVDSGFNRKRDIIETGNGLVKWNDEYKCSSDGLPCLNFFFDVPCPTQIIEYKKDCNCNRGVNNLNVLYTPTNGLNASISVYLNPKKTDTVLCEFENVLPGQQIQCESTYGKFHRKTYFVVNYEGNSGSCVGKFYTTCSGIKIGDKSKGCNDLQIISYVDGHGSFCDENVFNEDNKINEANAFVNHQKNKKFSFTELKGTHSYILYSLIGVIIIFFCAICFGFAICIMRKDENINGKDAIKYNLTAKSMQFKYNQTTIVNDDCSDTECFGTNVFVIER